jgi:single-strand DNA-binding protein
MGVTVDSYLTLLGRLVADPQQHAVAGGRTVTRFRIVNNRRRRDADGGWVDGDPVFMSVSCWRDLGDNVARSLRKGDAVVVHGRLAYREFGEGDTRRSYHEIEAVAVGPDLNRYAAELVRPMRTLPDPSGTVDDPEIEAPAATAA